MKKRLFLVDAYAIIFRSYYAFIRNPLINSKGMNVSAIQGFTSTLFELINKEKPTHIAVVSDPPGGSFRTDDFTEYKANRQATPEDIKISVPWIKKIIKGFNIPLLEVAGYEADDVIGTIAKKAEKDDFEVYMVTPDKDFGQLVSKNIFMYVPGRSGKPTQIMGVQEICEKWDIENVDQVIDILGMMGDSADNIPGIPGVGEKTAVKLLKQYGSMENLYQNTHELKGKLKEKVENNQDKAIISKKLATIILDVPVEYKPESYIMEDVDKEILEPIFAELEFKSLGKRVLGSSFSTNQVSDNKIAPQKGNPAQLDLFGNQVHQQLVEETSAIAGNTIENTDHNYKLCGNIESQKDLIKQLLNQKIVCFDTETTSVDANLAELVGMSFSWKKGDAFYVPIPENKEEAMEVVNRFKPFFENEKITKIGQNIKYDILVLKWYDVEVKGKMEDTMLAHYLIEPDMRHNMNILAETYLGYTPVSIETLIGKKGKNQLSMRDADPKKVAEYAGEDADITFQLYEKFNPILQEQSFAKLYDEVEVPLVNVLATMEFEGVKLDADFLNNYSEEIAKDIVDAKGSIFEASGVEFNLDSPKQMGEVLFDKMKIPYTGKKTKTGQYSTNEATLRKLANEHNIVEQILIYRELAKLKSTYVDALPKLVNPKTGRVHTSFNQAVAATGRLSSSDPNLQNIPIRTEQGRKVRKAFIPRSENHILLAADYSQIELRIMAAMSEDEAMMEAFNKKIDIHTATAAKVYGVSLEEVDRTMRGKAKMVNFGIIYGISAFGLAQRLGIKRGEAKELIDGYFATYPKVQTFMSNCVENAKKNGFAETILGRRRYLKDINSRNFTVRGFAERNAINAPIQGSAADMIKVAMIKIHEELRNRNFKSKMVLQVHDELLFDVEKSELEELKNLVKVNMETAIKLSVPTVVKMGTGLNWLEAH